jgi:GAF domain-containing protein
MMLKSMLPASAMGLFVLDEHSDAVVNCFAAGSHVPMIRAFTAAPGDGVVGWVAAHRRSSINAEPAIDFGHAVRALDPPLLSACAVPLVHDGAFVGVLAVYAPARQAFGEDHARLLDLLAPRLAASFSSVRAKSTQTAHDRQAASTFKLVRGARTG